MVSRRLYMVLAGVLSAALSYSIPAEQSAQQTPAAQTAAPAASTPAAAVPDKGGDPRAQIVARIPGTKVDDLRPSPIQGVYELTHGAEIYYVSSDGKYAISGDMYDVVASSDLTEQHRRETRAKLISAVPENQMLIFGPKDPKYTITVFTDVDCGYCRKLHSQIAEYNRLGIRVRYLFYPRTGPNTESWTKAEQVWCSNNRNEALTEAKLGQEIKAKPCSDNPVARHYALGRDFDLQGTPAIVMASGEMLPGYMSPPALMQHLQQAQAQRR